MDTAEVFKSEQDSNSSFIQVIEEGDDVGANVILATTSPPPPSRPISVPMKFVKVISSRILNHSTVKTSPSKLRGKPLTLSKPVIVKDAIEDYVIQSMKEETSETDNAQKYGVIQATEDTVMKEETPEDAQKYEMVQATEDAGNFASEMVYQPHASLKEVLQYELLYPGGPIEQVKVEHVLEEHDYVPVPEPLKEYYCGVCGKSYTSEKSVRQHMTRTHGVSDPVDKAKKKREQRLKKVVCELCGKNYASGAALRYHQRVHTGEKPFQCPECPKAFTMPLFLQIHLRTHTGERPYPCPDCPKAFSNQAALLRHSRVHTGIKPYTCEECGKSFTQSNSKKLHIRTVHLKLPAPYLSKKRRLRLHMKNALSQAKAALESDPGQMSYVIENGPLDGSFAVVAYDHSEDD